MCSKCNCETIRKANVVVMSLWQGEPPHHTCAAIGLAIALNKPIILVVTPGSQVPEKIALVVDRCVEWSADVNILGNAIKDAIIDLKLVSDSDFSGVNCSLN